MKEHAIGCGVAAGIVLLAGGCTAIDTKHGQVEASYFGYVRVLSPARNARHDDQVMTTHTEALGLRLEHGLGIGFYRDNRVYVPLDCRVVILVNNQQQLDDAIRRLKTEKEALCVTVKPS